MEKDFYAKLERLSTRKLESILRKSVMDRTKTPEEILVISEILERRDVGKGIGPPDADAAWARFLKKRQGILSGSPPETPPKNSVFLKIVRQRCAVIAICILSTASIVLATQALGYDIIGLIVHRTADFFHFETVSLSNGESEGLCQLDDLFYNERLPTEFAPSWLPPHFENTATKKITADGHDAIYEEYSDGEKYLSFILTKYRSSLSVNGEIFEKQEPEIEVCFCGSKKFVLAENGNSGFWTATWSDGTLVFHIQGDVTKGDLTKIIENLGGITS